jgi:hypothetical protein
MRAHRLLSRQMVDVGARDAKPTFCSWPTGGALTAGLDGPKVLDERGVAEVERAVGCYCVAEALWMS